MSVVDQIELRMNSLAIDPEEAAGVFVYKGLFPENVVVALDDAVKALSARGINMASQHTIFGCLDGDGSSLSKMMHKSQCKVIQYKSIPHESVFHEIYNSELFRRLIAKTLGVGQIFSSSDPSRAITVNILDDGGCLGWHFDAHDVTVTTVTRLSQQGGRFEYLARSRDLVESEDRDLEIKLDNDDSSSFCSTAREVGDVVVFMGRDTLHRVSEVRGKRHSVTWSFRLRPETAAAAGESRGLYKEGI